jgi:hypothetical protein
MTPDPNIKDGFPSVGSIWYNNRRQENYMVVGIVAHCEGKDDWEILYRSEDMPYGHYRRRSRESWFGTNREGF